MTKSDIEALQLAFNQTRGEDTDRRNQIDAKLEDESFIQVALFCAYHRQVDSLHLKPWQSPPCWIDDVDEKIAGADTHGRREAQRLLRQMLELGISKYHPDPVGAIEAAKARPAK